MPSGSYLAVAHVTDHDTDPNVHAVIERMYDGVPNRFHFRDRKQFARFFDGRTSSSRLESSLSETGLSTPTLQAWNAP